MNSANMYFGFKLDLNEVLLGEICHCLIELFDSHTADNDDHVDTDNGNDDVENSLYE